jgi:hypothetical protein
MDAVPTADIHEVRPLGVEHRPVVGVAVPLWHAEELAELFEGIRVAVGDRPKLDVRDALPTASVAACDRATGDDCALVPGHDW